MKSTVKRWCKDFGYTWHGPGVYGTERYDYNIHFGKGLAAMFRSAHGPCRKPKVCSTNRGKEFLIFPVYSQLVGQKEMSRFKFSQATSWVKDCLAGNMREYTENATAQQINPADCQSGTALSG